MASLFQDGSLYSVCFRLGGRQFRRSLKTEDRKEAQARLKRIEVTLYEIEHGRLTIPEGADVAKFVMSEGKLTEAIKIAADVSLGKLFDEYQAGKSNLEPTTMATVKTHCRWLTKTLGKSKSVVTINRADLQRYIRERCKTVSGTTAEKEMNTLRAIWHWGRRASLLTAVWPGIELEYPKAEEKPPFQTWKQIERAVARGGLTEEQIDRLWHSLWLSSEEVEELLDFVQGKARHSFVYPMFCFTAHTGCRRSEMLRARVADFDFETGNGIVGIREKKRDKSVEVSFRHVAMTQRLKTAMQSWFAMHDSELAICYAEDGKRITPQKAWHHWKQVCKGSKWENLRGFHVLRHSFVSNCASKGIDQRIIDAFVGHTTEAMRRRYRHLAPETLSAAIAQVFA